MTTFLKAITLAAFTATAAHAGGPIIREEPALPEMRPQGDGGEWVVPAIIGAVILCAIACGGGGDDAEPAAPPAPVPPGPVCFNDGGEC